MSSITTLSLIMKPRAAGLGLALNLALMVAGAGLTGAAFAQGSTAAGQPAAGCRTQAKAETPATPAADDQHGTAPGAAGSTGWTGGTGGSYIGTVPAGPNASSPNIAQHPEVARGLDPMTSVSRRRTC